MLRYFSRSARAARKAYWQRDKVVSKCHWKMIKGWDIGDSLATVEAKNYAGKVTAAVDGVKRFYDSAEAGEFEEAADLWAALQDVLHELDGAAGAVNAFKTIGAGAGEDPAAARAEVIYEGIRAAVEKGIARLGELEAQMQKRVTEAREAEAYGKAVAIARASVTDTSASEHLSSMVKSTES